MGNGNLREKCGQEDEDCRDKVVSVNILRKGIDQRTHDTVATPPLRGLEG